MLIHNHRKVHKMKNIYCLIVLFLLFGCASPPQGAHLVDSFSDLPSIQADFRQQLSQLKIGMTLSEFQKVLPKAYVGGQSHQITAYEVVNLQKYVTQADLDRQNFLIGFGSPRAKTNKQVLWFYFFKDKLVQWGQPKDWPKRPDLILEKRIR